MGKKIVSTLRVLLRSALLPCLALLVSEGECHAQATSTQTTAKGIAGGALLGSEITLMTGAAFGLKPAWAYLLGGVAGGAAGAYAGYHIAHGNSSKPPAFMLAGGIALVMPTIISVLTATHYDPEHYREEPASDDGAPVEEEAPIEHGAAAGPRLDAPNVAALQSFTADELHKFHVAQTTELHVCLLCGVF
jgi:hypothetical protein